MEWNLLSNTAARWVCVCVCMVIMYFRCNVFTNQSFKNKPGLFRPNEVKSGFVRKISQLLSDIHFILFNNSNYMHVHGIDTYLISIRKTKGVVLKVTYLSSPALWETSWIFHHFLFAVVRGAWLETPAEVTSKHHSTAVWRLTAQRWFVGEKMDSFIAPAAFHLQSSPEPKCATVYTLPNSSC